MTINLAYYKNWTKWWVNRTQSAVVRGDVVEAKALIDGGRRVMDLMVEPFSSFPSLKGNWLKIAGKLFQWGMANPDPLEDARNVMEDLRKQYDKA